MNAWAWSRSSASSGGPRSVVTGTCEEGGRDQDVRGGGRDQDVRGGGRGRDVRGGRTRRSASLHLWVVGVPWRATLRRGRDVRAGGRDRDVLGGRTRRSASLHLWVVVRSLEGHAPSWPGRARRADATERVPPFMGGCAFPGGPRSVVATQYDGSGHNGNGCDRACSSGHMPPAKPRLPSNLGHPVRRGHAGVAEMTGIAMPPVNPLSFANPSDKCGG